MTAVPPLADPSLKSPVAGPGDERAETPRGVRPPGKLAGRLWVLGAALLWSTSGLFAKAPIWDEWPVTVRGPLFAFWRALFATLVLVPLVRRARWNRALGPMAIVFAVMNVTYLMALTQTTAANAIWLQSTAPWWVFLISVLLLREAVVGRDLIPLAFGVLGVGTILFFEVRGQAQVGVLCGVASGVGYATVLLFMRHLRRENPAWVVAICHGVTAAVILPWVVYVGRWPSAAQLAVLAGFGAVQMGIPYTLLIRGLRSVSSQEAVAITLVEPILMPVWVLLLYHEVPAPWTVAGAGLILVGLVLRFVVWELLAGDRR